MKLNHRLVQRMYKAMISIKIKNPLFTYYARLVNILDFNPEKLSIKKFKFQATFRSLLLNDSVFFNHLHKKKKIIFLSARLPAPNFLFQI